MPVQKKSGILLNSPRVTDCKSYRTKKSNWGKNPDNINGKKKKLYGYFNGQIEEIANK